MTIAQRPKRVQSVAKALAVLKAVSQAETLSLSELARRVGMNASTAHHIVQTLADERFISQDPATRRYAIGPALLSILPPSTRSDLLTRSLRGPMTECAVATGFDVCAAVLQDDRVYYAARVAGRNPLKVEVPLYGTHPAYCVSAGRVLLSELDRPTMIGVLGRHTIRRYADATRTDLDEIIAAIECVRADGYSEVLNEHIDGVRDISVPVRGENGLILATLTIGAPINVFTDARRGGVLDALFAAAREAETALAAPAPIAPAARR